MRISKAAEKFNGGKTERDGMRKVIAVAEQTREGPRLSARHFAGTPEPAFTAADCRQAEAGIDSNGRWGSQESTAEQVDHVET